MSIDQSTNPRYPSAQPRLGRMYSLPAIKTVFASQVVKLGDRPIGLILAALGAIVFSLLAAGRGPDRDSHDAVLTALRTIDLANSSLQRDVLQARSGYLNNYDPLVSSVIELHNMLEILSSDDFGIGPGIGVPLMRLKASIANLETTVERFKTNNAMLQNSLRIFTVLLTDDPATQSGSLPPAAILSKSGNLMMRFLTHPEPELGKQISTLLGSIRPSQQAGSEKISSIAAHGREILRVQPVVDRLLSEIQASTVSQATQELQRTYLSEFGEVTRRAYWSRVFLGAVAVALCVYILFLAYRLRLQTDRLSRRLRFERSRSLIKTVFDDDTTSGGTEAIRLSMVEICELFSADGYTFEILNAESGQVEERYQSEEPGTEIPSFATEYFRELSSDGPDRIRRGRPFYKILHGHGNLAFSRDALSAGSALGMPISKRYSAIMVLEYPEGRQRPGVEEVTLMQDALELLTRCLDRLRKNQERELLESRLAHSERLQAVGTLAAGIAHEFNNILVFMLGYAEMALQIVKKPVTATRYLEGIVSAGERARQIIEQILALSRKRVRTIQPFDLCDAVSETVSLLSVSMPNVNSILADLPAHPMVILGSPVELQQIIVNLCNNAMDATDGTGHVIINVGFCETRSPKPVSHGILPPGKYVRLTVSDDGPGISESDMPHIFEPFFTTRPLAGGTGLGLSTVHGHIVAHDGFVNVSSVLGQSTRFDVFFPASHHAPVPIDNNLDRDELSVGSGQSVLLLEEDDAIRSMHEEKLAALSYEPKGFKSLAEVEHWLDNGKPRPDLAIIDVASLPLEIGKSDLDFVFEGIPCLLMIDPMRSGPLRAGNLRGGDTIRKPLDLRALAIALAKLTDNQRLIEPTASVEK